MTNIYFFETKKEAMAKVKEMKAKGSKVAMFKEHRPYKTDDGRLLYYSVIWTF